jgi:hypothetical protein
VETIMLGCQTYTQDQAISVMRHNVSGDKTYTAAFQLIAAKLNVLCKGSNADCVSSQIAAVDAFLCAHPIGSNVRASSPEWQAIKATVSALGKYNDGKLCAPSCDVASIQ